MQNRIKNKIPQIISGIAVTTLIISLYWFFMSRFWFWVSLELSSALLVAFGCSGEWWLHHHPAGRKKKEKDEHHKLEARFIAMVSLGVIMELFANAHSIKEGAVLESKVSESNERSKQLESTNLQLSLRVAELRKANDDLLRESLPRSLTFDTEACINSLRGQTNKIAVQFLYPANDPESFDFAENLSSCFGSSGWRILPIRPMTETDIPKSFHQSSEMDFIPLALKVQGGCGSLGEFAMLVKSDPTGARPVVIDAICKGGEKIGIGGATLGENPDIPDGVLWVIIPPKQGKGMPINIETLKRLR